MQRGGSSGEGTGHVVAGRHELLQRLGRGGMGEVWRARDRATGRVIALKRLRADASQDRAIAGAFMREYHALALLRHPRIIEVYDFGMDGQLPYYTMELLDGQDLSDLSPLPYREACSYLRDVASSLALLHARRLLHRDVSPRNVRRTSDGRCKLLDFGAMMAFGVPPNVTGTAPCVPPEALHGAALDQRTDLYALGALAYRVLTGQHGYDANDFDSLPEAWAKPLVRPRRIVREIPEALDELVVSLLSLDPMKRPKSAAAVIDWLSAIGELPAEDTANDARSFLTASRLCGRDATRRLLTRSMEFAIDGHAAMLLVEGAPGSGKSRILEEAAVVAQTCGLTPVRVVARGPRGASYSLAQNLVAAVRQVLPVEAERARIDELPWFRTGRSAQQLPAAKHSDAAEQRSRLQESLVELFRNVARQRPLLITVDDLEHADEFSVALVTAIAHQARGLPLVIVASRTEGAHDQYPNASIALAEIATHVRLRDLDRAQNAELVESMFGRVPNLDRLNAWMFGIAHGNPKLTVALAEHLLTRGIVRYVDGTWVLPDDEITESVPSDLAQMLALRLRRLRPQARALAELVSVRRGGAAVELCLEATSMEPAEVFESLGDLVREGVLESAGRDYAFVQNELRKVIRDGLPPERSRELHRRWAEVLLAQPAPDLESRLEAGWHLVHTEDELRGADILAEVGPELVEQGLSMSTALPAIEAALAIYERRGRPLRARLRLRSTLVLCGYLFDYRLATRYGEETLALLHEVAGLALAEKLARVLGRKLGFLIAVLSIDLRRLWPPRARSHPSGFTAQKYFVRAAMGLLGMRAVALDVEGARAVLAKMAPLGSSFLATGRLVYECCRAIAVQTHGRESELDRLLQAPLKRLRKGPVFLMREEERQALLIGLLTCDGINECYRENSRALERAAALEAVGNHLALTAAHRIRMIAALTHGELERAEEFRRMIDLHGIQGGTTWQVEWFAVSLEGMLGGTWTDLVLLRRSLERLRRMVEDMPWMLPHLQSVQIMYHFRHGEFAAAAELGERYVAAHPPRTIVGWGVNYAATAMALVEAGHAERARALCEHALAHLPAEDRVYTVMYGQLEVAHATALAVLGDRARADRILSQRIARLEAASDHAGLVSIHQDRARIARLLNDRYGLREALESMQREALAAGSPALVLLADRTAELRARIPDSPLPAATHGGEQGTEKTRVQRDRALTKFMHHGRAAKERPQHALQLLARYAGSDEAYLFVRVRGGVAPVAGLGNRNAPDQLTQAVAELAQSGAVGGESYGLEILTPAGDPARFRAWIVSGGEDDREGVAVVREQEASAPLAGSLLDDLCIALGSCLPSPAKQSANDVA